MSDTQWTPEQKDSFTAHGGTLLVSAAAGSGKTAVLVERVIRMVTGAPDENGVVTMPPVDVDRLLIVTFTRAAAAEMRQRLSKALAEKMAENPDNTTYLRQQMLLPRAYISTIHGFCSRLLQEFSAQADVPFGFKVAEEGQTKLLLTQALDTVLEENYRKGDKAFLNLAGQLCGVKNDKPLREAVLTAYTFMQAQPFPEQWLQEQVDAYTQVIPLEKTRWMKPILTEMDMMLERMLHYGQRYADVAQEHHLTEHVDKISIDMERLSQLRDSLYRVSYDELRQAVFAFQWQTMPRFRPQTEAEEAAKNTMNHLRDKRIKGVFKDKFKEEFFACTEAECRDDLAKLAPLMEALARLVQEFSAKFTQLKRQQKWLDYNDLEHATLHLLMDADGNPTPLAREISLRFDEIMVDEYQDTNAAQDALFQAISKEGQNLFMVGDVKQSIYGFRQAMPSIFTGKRDGYTPYNRKAKVYPATITLGNNFRSREQVTEAVNFLFRQLMGRRLGGVEYDKNEALVPSAKYPPADYATEWMLLDKANAGSISEVQAEARQIGGRILELMKTMTVQRKKKEDGTTDAPELTFQDICILHRKKADMPIFYKELTKMGIPVAADKGERFLDTPEISTALSLLRAVDNPLRDVALAATLMSPIYAFTPDEMAQIRMVDRYKPLYVVLDDVCHSDALPALTQRIAAFMAQMRRFRTLAVSLPADRLLETIFRETDMEAVFLAQAGGAQRVANLQQLDQVARGYDPGEYRGLSAFIRYVDRVEASGEDLPSGDTLQQEGVRLMTVHGSKGLEYPVVFVSRLSKKRGGTDDQKRMLFHAESGIGMKLIDEEEGERHKPLPFVGVREARRIDEAAEDLRVWYVALTRAREKLILVDSVEEPEKLLEKLALELPDQEQLLPDTVLRAANPGEMLLTASLRHKGFASLPIDASIASLHTKNDWVVTLRPSLVMPEDEDNITPEPDQALADELTRRLEQVEKLTDDRAPLQGVPAKLAASQLSHHQLSREHIAKATPAFLQKAGLTPAQKGTAMHTFMQFADYAAAAEDLLAEIDRLTAAGFLTTQQAVSLDVDKLGAFFSGELYRRMTASQRVWREYPFAVMVPAGTVAPLPEELATEEVLVQGIADCVFQEGDGLVLVDYKTDRVNTAQELSQRYHSQMTFYKRALQTILGLPVKEMLLYSFGLGKTVEVTE